MTLQVAVGLLNRFGMLGTYMIRTIHARQTHHFGWGRADTGPEPPPSPHQADHEWGSSAVDCPGGI